MPDGSGVAGLKALAPPFEIAALTILTQAARAGPGVAGRGQGPVVSRPSFRSPARRVSLHSPAAPRPAPPRPAGLPQRDRRAPCPGPAGALLPGRLQARGPEAPRRSGGGPAAIPAVRVHDRPGRPGSPSPAAPPSAAAAGRLPGSPTLRPREPQFGSLGSFSQPGGLGAARLHPSRGASSGTHSRRVRHRAATSASASGSARRRAGEGWAQQGRDPLNRRRRPLAGPRPRSPTASPLQTDVLRFPFSPRGGA